MRSARSRKASAATRGPCPSTGCEGKPSSCTSAPGPPTSSSPPRSFPAAQAPVLLKEETVCAMKPGSVVVDMAIEQGGNCPPTEKDQIVIKHGVKLIGISNLPALVAADASALYARNLLNFLNLLVDPKTGELKLNREDEIIPAILL